MNQTRFERLQDVFQRALDVPPDARPAYVEQACGGDVSLLTAVTAMLDEDSRSTSLLDRGIGQAAGAVFDRPAAVVTPAGDGTTADVIGPYRLLRVIGEGGMGVVHLAERTDLGTHVAIKFLRDAWLSPARRERFTTEQRTLARLNHFAIARLYDAGALANGTPWIAMEYVDGVPITEYCRIHGVSIIDRLLLLRAVGDAIQHAHRHLIVHRDLKPSNVMVTADGVVKLLDFGIAKQLDAAIGSAARTTAGMRLMTPAYAAPEQVRGDALGLHTDVYGLGALLYELLTGSPPFDLTNRSPAEAERIVLDEAPVRPSVRARRDGAQATPPDVRRFGASAWADLDVICLTAMHKEPARRYASAEAFLRDLAHYLNGEPLEARPDAIGYRAAKFLKRNRTPVAATAAGLFSLIGVAAFYTYRLARARDAAITEAARARRLQALMTSLLTGGEDATAPAESLRVLDVVDRGVLEAETLAGEPIVQADLFYTLGSLYHSLGRFADAERLLSKALTQRQSLLGADSVEVAEIMVARGLLRLDQGQYAEAEQLTRDALDMTRRHVPHGDARIATTATALGQVLEERGGYTEAVPVLEEAVRTHEAHAAASADLASSLRHLGSVHFYAGTLDKAAEIFDRVLTMTRLVKGDRHALVAEDLINVGAVHFERGRYAEAERYYRDALSITEQWYGRDHHQTASNLAMLARAVHMQTRYDEAAPMLERALAVRERVFGMMHPRVASAINEVGSIALQRKQYGEAEAAFRRMGEIYRAAYPDTHYLHALATANLASVFNAKEEFDQAEPLFREAIAIYAQTQGAEHPNVGIAHVKLGRALLGQQQYAEAEAATLKGFAILTAQTSPSVSWLKAAREDLIKIYVASDRPERAEALQAELDAAATAS